MAIRDTVTRIVISAKDDATAVFTSLQAKVAGVAAAIGTYFSARLFSASVDSAREFESAMSAVQAAAGASGEELDALRAAAEEAGATTKYTSVEAAGALENLAKAGLNATQAVQALPAVLDLASAGGVSLGESSEFITKAVAGMGLSFAEAGRVADVLAMGANASNTSVQGLAQALSYAAPTANSLGLSLEQTVAIIGKFADAGIDASRAGTALNSILAQFSNPASKFRQELAAAGITTGDFDQALRQLAAAGPEGQKAILAVGQEAGPALRALLNQGIGSLDALKAKLDESAGSARSFAQVMSDNVDGAAKGLGSAWEALLIKLGTPVLEPLKEQINALATRLREFVANGTATAFGESIAAALRSAGQWFQEFLSKVDFQQVAANLRTFAADARDLFTRIGEHATTAGNVVRLAYGVMSSGISAVVTAWNSALRILYTMQEGVGRFAALVNRAFASITFGDVSAGFRQMAAEMDAWANQSAAAAQHYAEKSGEAFAGIVEGAETANAAWRALTETASESAGSIQNAANATQKAGTQAALSADQLDALGEGFEFVDGEARKAAEGIDTTGDSAKKSASAMKTAEASAADVAAAYERLGITSEAALNAAARNAQRDFEMIRSSGTASARDIQAAFAAYAQRAIAANGGVASATLKAQAAQHGLKIEADETGRVIVRSMAEAKAATEALATAADDAREQFFQIGGAAEDAAEKIARLQQPEGGGNGGKGGGRGTSDYSSPFQSLYARAEQIGGLTMRKELETYFQRMATRRLSQGGTTTASSKRMLEILDEMTKWVDERQLAKEAAGSTFGPPPGRSTTTPHPDGGHRVEITINGRRQTVTTKTADDADTLVNIMRELERAASVAQ